MGRRGSQTPWRWELAWEVPAVGVHTTVPPHLPPLPGCLQVTVTYTLRDDNSLTLEMEATADAPTPINLAQHTYFNLAGWRGWVGSHAAGQRVGRLVGRAGGEGGGLLCLLLLPASSPSITLDQRPVQTPTLLLVPPACAGHGSGDVLSHEVCCYCCRCPPPASPTTNGAGLPTPSLPPGDTSLAWRRPARTHRPACVVAWASSSSSA